MIKKKYAEGSAQNEFIDGDKPVQTRSIIKNVATTIGRIVGNTLGPGGRNYMIPDGITNDGVSILKHIRFEDEREDSIASAYEEIARRQDLDAGDGTSTATVIGCDLTPRVLEDVIAIDTPIPGQKTVMEIKQQLEQEAITAIELLKQEAKPIKSVEDLELVAQTAVEGHECAGIIAETIWEVGKDSNTSIDEGFNGKVEKKVVPGIEMPLKIETPSMYTNETRKEAVLEDVLVVVANHVFESYSDLSNFMLTMMNEKKAKKEGGQPIVIIGKQFSVQFVSQIVGVTRSIGIPILLLSAGGLKDEEFIDIAEFVDANYINTHPKEGVKMSTLEYKDVGRVKKLIAGPEQTSFIGGQGLESVAVTSGEDQFVSRVEARVAELKKLAETEQNPEVRELLERRAAGLKGGVATLYVDAKTAVDRFYLKKKVEDALNSCKAAFDGGTVAGGGVALKRVGEKLDGDYLPEALKSVYNRIQLNAGGELDIDEDTVRDAFYTNKSAIENAVAVIKILVTTEGVIADKEISMVEELGKVYD